MDNTRQSCTVMDEDRGVRLDVFISQKFPSLSRSQVKILIDDGEIWVNEVPVSKAGLKLRTGDEVDFSIREVQPSTVAAQDIPLCILYEDRHLLVIDKPAGMVIHPAPGHREGTLVNAILHHCDDLSGIGGVIRPGIVHRLDKETSGVLLVAKNDETHRHLSDQFKAHQVKKTYKALVFGSPGEDEGVIELPVGRHPADRKKMSTKSRRGKDAITRWRVAGRYGEVTLLDVDIETGRTHQIRVHLSALGYPVVGGPGLRRDRKTEVGQGCRPTIPAFGHAPSGPPRLADRVYPFRGQPDDGVHRAPSRRYAEPPGLSAKAISLMLIHQLRQMTGE